VKLSSTRLRDLAGLAVVVAALAFAVARIVGSSGTVPTAPWLAPLTIAAVGIALIVTARVLRPRLQREEGTKPVEPLVAGRLVALSFAASRAGAVLVGLYAGWLVAALLVPDGLDSPFGRGRAIVLTASWVASVLVVVGGLQLERALTIRANGASGRADEDPDKPSPA
jgi:hypothetical protein